MGDLSETTCPTCQEAPRTLRGDVRVALVQILADENKRLREALASVVDEFARPCCECDATGSWVEAIFNGGSKYWCDDHVSIPQKAISKGANRYQPQRFSVPEWLSQARAALRVGTEGEAK